MRGFIAAALAASVNAVVDSNDLKFINYMTKFAKDYVTFEEYKLRKEWFIKSEGEINQLNSSQSDSVHAHNQFSDWTEEEYKRMAHGFKTDKELGHFDPRPVQDENQMFGSINLCNYGYCSTIKNQGYCSSCYAFAAIAAMEADLAEYYKIQAPSLSA
jgi:C1A family cysteine protease